MDFSKCRLRLENKQLIQDLDGQQRGTTQQVQKMGLEILYIRDKQGDDTNRINEIADEISEIKEDIEEIKQTTSRQRPPLLRLHYRESVAIFRLEETTILVFLSEFLLNSSQQY
jgi:CII-binding regulator of phage lambda lysogenization HflD